MVVALTGRHFRDLVEVTGTGAAVAALADALGVDFGSEGDRYRYRDVLSGLFATWFADHTADEITTALSGTTVLFERYRTFAQAAAGPKVTANPLFSGVAPTRRRRLSRPGIAGRVRRHPSRQHGPLPPSDRTPPTSSQQSPGPDGTPTSSA